MLAVIRQRWNLSLIHILIRSEEIYKKANSIVKSCGTRDTLKIARELGIHLHFLDNLNDLLGMYIYRHKEQMCIRDSHEPQGT